MYQAPTLQYLAVDVMYAGDSAASLQDLGITPASSVVCANQQDVAAQAVMPRSQLLLWQCCRCRRSLVRGTSIS